jgi:hypothetical protein
VGVRRERPPVESSLNTIRLRLPDGTVKTMPVESRSGHPSSDSCCFCGATVEQPEREGVVLSARWIDEGEERTQAWVAHRTCLAERVRDWATP